MKYLPYLSAITWPFSAAIGYIAWLNGLWPITVISVFVSSLGIHSLIIMVHETAHYGVSRNRAVNDLVGIIAGTLTLSPMNVYRMLHRYHHGMLGSERDLEFWPYVNKGVPRRMRVFSAVVELTLASPYFICMFMRSILIGKMNSRVRRRCWRDFGLAVVFAFGLLAVVTANGWWAAYLIGLFIPLEIAGLMVTWRRMVEHLGLCDPDPDRMTRLVIPSNRFEQFICHLFFNEPYHAAHHKKSSIEWTKLPAVSEQMLEEKPELRDLYYTSYLKAIPDMLQHVSNPRIGKHWLST